MLRHRNRRRSGFATWLFRPAATGWYPEKAPQPARPVPVLAEPWPGVPVRGCGAHGRADACWVPIAPKLTPHGLRHSHRTHGGVGHAAGDYRILVEDVEVEFRWEEVGLQAILRGFSR